MTAIKKKRGHGSIECPLCGKTVEERGFNGHLRFGHKDAEGRALLAQKTAKTLEREESYRARLAMDAGGLSEVKSEGDLTPEEKQELTLHRNFRAAGEALLAYLGKKK